MIVLIMPERIMGLDLGEKTIGVALSDETALIAQPLCTLKRVAIKKDLQEIAQIVEEYKVQEIIFGLPLHMNGNLSPMAEKVIKFSKRLRGKVPVPIHTWDERLTSVAAERALVESGVKRKKRKKWIDQIAACLILQGWLDHRAKNQEKNPE